MNEDPETMYDAEESLDRITLMADLYVHRFIEANPKPNPLYITECLSCAWQLADQFEAERLKRKERLNAKGT